MSLFILTFSLPNKFRLTFLVYSVYCILPGGSFLPRFILRHVQTSQLLAMLYILLLTGRKSDQQKYEQA